MSRHSELHVRKLESLIASQALKLEAQDKLIEEYAASFKGIRIILYGIGGPLNDNKLHYSKEQLAPFSRIAAELFDRPSEPVRNNHG